MYEEVLEKILKSMDEKLITANYPKFSSQDYKAHRIDLKNFHEIKKAVSSSKIAFVDGGNAEILGSSNFSLNLVKVCYAVYRNNKKLKAKKFEIFALVQALSQSNEIYFKVTFIKAHDSIDLEEVSFSSFDHALMMGSNRAEISSVANAVRRFAELKLAKIVSDEKIADIIVLDGNLQSTLTNENKYLNELYESCLQNNVILGALSKTTSLFTDNGNLLSVVLGSISSIPSWFYYPVAEVSSPHHLAEMYFVKLHPHSRHIFRFEIFNIQKDRAEEAIGVLAGNCIDPIFIGYPYGLVEADRIARVGNNEKESLKTIFLVKLKNRNIEKYLSSVDAHEILDKISFNQKTTNYINYQFKK